MTLSFPSLITQSITVSCRFVILHLSQLGPLSSISTITSLFYPGFYFISLGLLTITNFQRVPLHPLLAPSNPCGLLQWEWPFKMQMWLCHSLYLSAQCLYTVLWLKQKSLTCHSRNCMVWSSLPFSLISLQLLHSDDTGLSVYHHAPLSTEPWIHSDWKHRFWKHII